MASSLQELLAAAVLEPELPQFPFDREQYLPCGSEGGTARHECLERLLKNIWLSVQAREYTTRLLTWTKELKEWLALGRALPRNIRAALIEVYYELALAPNMDEQASQVFVEIISTLAR